MPDHASKLMTRVSRRERSASGRSSGGMTTAIRAARKLHLMEFAQLVFPGYEIREYLEGISEGLMLMCRYYESGGREGVQNVVVSMPRRYGKSEISRIFALYFLARNPNARVILVSYGSSLSYKHSRAARDYISTENILRFFPQLELNEESKSRSEWNLKYFRGGMDAAGITGGLTGKGYSLLLADDLIKNWTDANSQVVSNQIWDDFQSSVLNGADSAYAVKLCIGTRWTFDDPIGRLLGGATSSTDDIRSESWLNFNLPAISYEHQRIVSDGRVLYEREEDEPLYNPRHTMEQLWDIESTTPRYLWESQWQQRPLEEMGKIIRLSWIEAGLTHLVPPRFKREARGWDLAWSANDLSDWSVGVKMGICEDDYIWILDMVRFRLDFGDLVPRIAAIAKRDGTKVSQYIEKNARGAEATRILNMDSRLYGHRLRSIPVSLDKLTRAQPFIGRLAEGVLKIKVTHWTQLMKEEMLAFTGNKDRHDDIVDAISLCYNGLVGRSPLEVGTGRLRL